MYLVRMGWRTVNLEYLIEAADSALGAPPSEVTPGHVRVSIYPGKHFEVGGEAAAQLRVHLDDSLKPLPSPAEGKGNGGQRARPKGARMRPVSSPPKSSPREE